MKALLTLISLFFIQLGHAQNSYIYLELDKNLPVSVQYNGTNLVNNNKGYIIIPRSRAGENQMAFRFQNPAFANHTFYFFIENGKSYGFQLKKVSASDFVLRDLVNDVDLINGQKVNDPILTIAATTTDTAPKPDNEEKPKTGIISILTAKDLESPVLVKVKKEKRPKQKETSKNVTAQTKKEIITYSEPITKAETPKATPITPIKTKVENQPIPTTSTNYGSKEKNYRKINAQKKKAARLKAKEDAAKLKKEKDGDRAYEPQLQDPDAVNKAKMERQEAKNKLKAERDKKILLEKSKPDQKVFDQEQERKRILEEKEKARLEKQEAKRQEDVRKQEEKRLKLEIKKKEEALAKLKAVEIAAQKETDTKLEKGQNVGEQERKRLLAEREKEVNERLAAHRIAQQARKEENRIANQARKEKEKNTLLDIDNTPKINRDINASSRLPETEIAKAETKVIVDIEADKIKNDRLQRIESIKQLEVEKATTVKKSKVGLFKSKQKIAEVDRYIDGFKSEIINPEPTKNELAKDRMNYELDSALFIKPIVPKDYLSARCLHILEESEMDKMKQELPDRFDDLARLNLIKRTLPDGCLTTDQINSILGTMTTEIGRVNAVEYLYPRIADQENIARLFIHFKYKSNRKRLAELGQ